MEEHPIEGLMETAMDSIRDMIDVNTIIGEAIQINENVRRNNKGIQKNRR